MSSYNGAFKNYRSQLNGWAIAQAVAMGIHNIGEAMEAAKQIADFAYVAEKDFEDMTQRLGEVIKNVPDPLEKVRALIGELQMVEEQIANQKDAH